MASQVAVMNGARPMNGIGHGPGPKPIAAPKPAQGQTFNRAIDRVDAIPKSKELETNDIRLRYAYLSQRGFYPDDPFKENQDSYTIHETISKQYHGNEMKMDSFFGIFDGHGKSGHECARYTKNNLPHKLKLAMDEVRAKAPDQHDIHRDQIEAALKRAHVETNEGLCQNTQIDDSLSGTTAISVYYHGRRNRITISNVGDSRAIVATVQTPVNGRGPATLKAFPLSRDQTPYRKDERARVRKTGARILSLDQMEGLEPIGEVSENGEEELELGEELDEDGDPPRIWHPTEEFPGCAFTRSIGDHKAEELGVIAVPEMLTREIHPDDKMIILASDGVWEFLTNQSVIDICAKFRDPLEACRAVVAEAYELWLQYELRTDDITIIAIYIDEVKSSMYGSSSNFDVDPSHIQPGHPEESDNEEIKNTILPETGFRPVRKHVSKDKQKEINKLRSQGSANQQQQQQDDEDFDLTKLVTSKTEDEKKSIEDAVRASVMFRSINEQQRQLIFSCMESVHVKKGTWVIKQGDKGDKFYIIDEGFFEVRILPEGMKDETGEGGNIIHVYEGSREKHMHPAFGELALLYSAPRTASIVAQSDGHLWALHRSAFRQVLCSAHDKYKELKKTLVKIPCFKHLDTAGMNKLATCWKEVSFMCGENITEQGYPGKRMYVVKLGSCYSVEIVPGQTKRGTVKQGNYIGEEVFETGTYNKTVTVLQATKCWQLDVDVAKETMGDLLKPKN